MYVYVYYVQAITTTWQAWRATSIWCTTYKVTESYQYIPSLCCCEIHLLGFICSCSTFIYTKYVIFYVFLLIITKLCLFHKFRINFIVIFCHTKFFCSQIHILPPEKVDLQNKVNIWKTGIYQGSGDHFEGDRNSDLNFLDSEILGNTLM